MMSSISWARGERRLGGEDVEKAVEGQGSGTICACYWMQTIQGGDARRVTCRWRRCNCRYKPALWRCRDGSTCSVGEDRNVAARGTCGDNMNHQQSDVLLMEQ